MRFLNPPVYTKKGGVANDRKAQRKVEVMLDAFFAASDVGIFSSREMDRCKITVALF
jgi:hypothetical protein